MKESIDSVINQTYKNLEIIIVDDGSDDGSEFVCDLYKNDSRVKVIHQKNKGLSGARNTALDIANGDYIAFLDSDDAYLPDMIQTMVESIERSKADIAVCGYNKVYSKGNLNGKKNKKLQCLRIEEEEIISREDAVKCVISKLRTCVWNKLFRKEIWNNLRFPEGRVFEDVWLFPQLLEKTNRIHLIPKSLVIYRQRPGSITSTISLNNLEDELSSRRFLEESFSKYILKEPEKYYEFREDVARQLTVCYAEMIRLKGKNESTANLKKEILFKWNSLNGNITQKKSKVIFFLLKNAPSLLYPCIVISRAL
ncbi:MAG: glycosyltransferase family 2 protein [Lachnospiraceae bacterium]|nr:glycosyltransferase family 2 protein [Lachnospiraceae bacterium]